MRYLHTMVRIGNIEQSLAFYCGLLGLEEVRRIDNPLGRFTLIFLAAPGDKARAAEEKAPLLELTLPGAGTLVTWPSRSMTSTPRATG
jgi:lactoylglutathione lyase